MPMPASRPDPLPFFWPAGALSDLEPDKRARTVVLVCRRRAARRLLGTGRLLRASGFLRARWLLDDNNSVPRIGAVGIALVAGAGRVAGNGVAV
jgi:hypothetical protein